MIPQSDVEVSVSVTLEVSHGRHTRVVKTPVMTLAGEHAQWPNVVSQVALLCADAVKHVEGVAGLGEFLHEGEDGNGSKAGTAEG